MKYSTKFKFSLPRCIYLLLSTLVQIFAVPDMLNGGIKNLDLDDQTVYTDAVGWANDAKSHYSSENVVSCVYEVHKITKYTSQLVAGVKYTLEYIQKREDGDSCSEFQVCDASIWRREWMPKNEQNQFTVHCKEWSESSSSSGGFIAIITLCLLGVVGYFCWKKFQTMRDRSYTTFS